MRSLLNNIYTRKYILDVFSLMLFISVSICFQESYKLAFFLVIGISIYQFYRLKKEIITKNYFFTTYFYLLIYSSVFYGSMHKIILIILLVFFWFFIKNENKEKEKHKNYYPEILVLALFGLIFLSTLVFTPRLKNIDIYIYYLLIPLLFINIKKNGFQFSVLKSMKVLITSILIVSFLLFFMNLYFNTFSMSINTFFSKYLEVTHVYYGMFLGICISFILILNLNKNNYINVYVDALIVILFSLLLLYIGARISFIAIMFVLLIFAFQKLTLSMYFKTPLFFIVLFSLLFFGGKTPRFQKGIRGIEKVYESVKTNNKKDIVANSWSNMYQRFLVTKYTIEEIKNHYVFGIGIQNVATKISKKIRKDGFIYFETINPHNQYLHFMVGLGIFGFIYFIYMLCVFLKGTTNFTFLFILFFLITMLTESILVRGKGMSLFFLFTLSFLMNKTFNTVND
ncbi:O-antigen ligase family protein [Tenacibaculum halocynthiae]|uniref:O-antigen ligase family protein n=1 Tax=Tenacibaculum halocynthiae TaxID=1254437 RepID=UPI003894CF94